MNGLRKIEYPFWVHFILYLLRGWLFIYDLLAYLPFKFFASPKRKLQRSNRIKAKPLIEGDPSGPYRSLECPNGELSTIEFPGCDTLDKIFDRAVKLYGDSDCLGSRQILSVDQEKQPDGRIFEKYDMSDYNWLTYEALGNETLELGSGLLKLNHKPRDDRVVIFAETREEWLITALTCFRYNFPIVTVYATLGDEAIALAINETEPRTMFTTQELTPKVVKILPQCPSIRRLVYYESRLPNVEPLDVEALTSSLPNPNNFRIISFKDLIELGAEQITAPIGPKPEDVALIMYTSGTTGRPKGVILTHYNFVAANSGQCAYVPDMGPPDVYIAYLPLAHILELTIEFGSLSHGVKIGYSSSLTLTDNASKIKRGAKGDVTVLRPTWVAAVPIILDRIYKAVIDKVEHSSIFSRALFEFLYELKRSKIETGYDTPFLNRLVFKKIRAILGGNVRLMLSGGAPLNAETQRFMNICFCCPIGQGWGLTETCGAGCVCVVDDLSTSRVGPPLRCSDVMLRDWAEGGYLTSNTPYPQGELLVAGGNVCAGYFNNPARMAEDFVEIDGRIWFATGDIGEFFWDGTLKIIDRKKDLVKLRHGEYVSLAKVESVLMTNPLVDNACVYGNSELGSYMVALIVPNEKCLTSLAKKLGVKFENFNDLHLNANILKAVLVELQAHSKSNRLEKFERPERIHLCKEMWTIDSGLLTDAMKLKRKSLENFYKEVLHQLYDSNGHDYLVN